MICDKRPRSLDSRMIQIISGTNRPGSNSLRVTRVLEGMFAELGVPVGVIDLAKLPADLFTPDAYATKPAAFEPYQTAIFEARGIVSVVPEYNGSFPGILKYFIDMLKFPESLRGVPAAFVGLGAGEWGGLRSVEQLEMVFQYRSAHLFGKRVFLKHVHKLIGDDGSIVDAAVCDRLAEMARDFVRFTNSLAETSEAS